MLNENIKNRLISMLFIKPSIYLISNPFKIFEFKELLRDVEISKEEIILDIGCGNGLQTILIGKKCKKIYGIDISQKSIIIWRLFLSRT